MSLNFIQNQSGFFCSDLSLRYPYRPCTINIPMLGVIVLIMPMVFIAAVELLRRRRAFYDWQFANYLVRTLWRFAVGFIATYLTSEVAKNVVGRLRPHFYEACQPLLSDGSSCDNASNRNVYVENYSCTNKNLTNIELRELYYSFPSAHSALSFYAMLYLAIYLHAVWPPPSRLLCLTVRCLLQFGLLLIAWYISLSRVVDYWHHWSDVLTGIAMGVFYAVLTTTYVRRLLHYHKICDIEKQVAGGGRDGKSFEPLSIS